MPAKDLSTQHSELSTRLPHNPLYRTHPPTTLALHCTSAQHITSSRALNYSAAHGTLGKIIPKIPFPIFNQLCQATMPMTARALGTIASPCRPSQSPAHARAVPETIMQPIAPLFLAFPSPYNLPIRRRPHATHPR
jgi:hypothetical protein